MKAIEQYFPVVPFIAQYFANEEISYFYCFNLAHF